MLNKSTIDSLKAVCQSRTHCGIERATFCALVRESGSEDEGAVKSYQALEKAVDIETICVETKDLANLINTWEQKHTGESDGAVIQDN